MDAQNVVIYLLPILLNYMLAMQEMFNQSFISQDINNTFYFSYIGMFIFCLDDSKYIIRAYGQTLC